jgi:hypothetical protein
MDEVGVVEESDLLVIGDHFKLGDERWLKRRLSLSSKLRQSRRW